MTRASELNADPVCRPVQIMHSLRLKRFACCISPSRKAFEGMMRDDRACLNCHTICIVGLRHWHPLINAGTSGIAAAAPPQPRSYVT